MREKDRERELESDFPGTHRRTEEADKMPSSKHLTAEQQAAAIELAKTSVPVKTILHQLQISRATFTRI